jgi:N utilization substance protein A
MAVASRQEGLDPVGATVGQRGGRVQAVVAELGGEKIDVIPWSDDPDVFVANALSPAQVVGVEIDEAERIASVTVPERMLSLAIGREGQNARLAAKLTGWRIDIRSETGSSPEHGKGIALPDAVAEPDEPAAEEAAPTETAVVEGTDEAAESVVADEPQPDAEPESSDEPQPDAEPASSDEPQPDASADETAAQEAEPETGEAEAEAVEDETAEVQQ